MTAPQMLVEKKSLQGVIFKKKKRQKKHQASIPSSNLFASSVSEFTFLCLYGSDLIPAMI